MSRHFHHNVSVIGIQQRTKRLIKLRRIRSRKLGVVILISVATVSTYYCAFFAMCLQYAFYYIRSCRLTVSPGYSDKNHFVLRITVKSCAYCRQSFACIRNHDLLYIDFDAMLAHDRNGAVRHSFSYIIMSVNFTFQTDV